MSRRRKKEQQETPAEEVKRQDWKEITYLTPSGEHKLGDILKETDIFAFDTHRTVDGHRVTIPKYKISYEALKRIARDVGLSYTFKLLVDPSINNKFTTYLAVTLICSCESQNDARSCIHGFPLREEDRMMKLGEANDDNTKSISQKYKGIMAEKRGFERAVIEHLGLPNMYGESEFDEEQKEEGEPKKDKHELSLAEYKGVSVFMNKIISSETVEALTAVGLEIKEAKDLSEKQVNYLRALYDKQLTKLNA